MFASTNNSPFCFDYFKNTGLVLKLLEFSYGVNFGRFLFYSRNDLHTIAEQFKWKYFIKAIENGIASHLKLTWHNGYNRAIATSAYLESPNTNTIFTFLGDIRDLHSNTYGHGVSLKRTAIGEALNDSRECKYIIAYDKQNEDFPTFFSSIMYLVLSQLFNSDNILNIEDVTANREIFNVVKRKPLRHCSIEELTTYSRQSYYEDHKKALNTVFNMHWKQWYEDPHLHMTNAVKLHFDSLYGNDRIEETVEVFVSKCLLKPSNPDNL
jgi:hypothetical protein